MKRPIQKRLPRLGDRLRGSRGEVYAITELLYSDRCFVAEDPRTQYRIRCRLPDYYWREDAKIWLRIERTDPDWPGGGAA